MNLHESFIRSTMFSVARFIKSTFKKQLSVRFQVTKISKRPLTYDLFNQMLRCQKDAKKMPKRCQSASQTESPIPSRTAAQSAHLNGGNERQLRNQRSQI